MIQQFQICELYGYIGLPSNYQPKQQRKVLQAMQKTAQQLLVQEKRTVFLQVADPSMSTKRNHQLVRKPMLYAKNGKLDHEHWACANRAMLPKLRTQVQLQQLLSICWEYFEELRIPKESTIQERCALEQNKGLQEYCYQDVPIFQDKSKPKNFQPFSKPMLLPNLQSKNMIGVRRQTF